MPTAPAAVRRRPLRWIGSGLATLAALYLLLLIPEPQPPQPKGAGKQAFLWNRDAFWQDLETRFREARTWDAARRTTQFDQAFQQFQDTLFPITETNLPPDAPAWDTLEKKFFEFAPVAAACPERLLDFLSAAARISQLVKHQSEAWPVDSV